MSIIEKFYNNHVRIGAVAGNKYEINEEGRIVALKSFGDVKEGDVGGFVDSEANLSQKGNCWIYDNAKVYDNAIVSGEATVSGSAIVSGGARVSGSAVVSEDAVVDYEITSGEVKD